MVGRMLVERHVVRALLLTPDAETLLIRIKGPEGDVFWVAPGGGIEPGETVEVALQREMSEELGLHACQLGPMVWQRHHIFDWGDERLSQHEQYHVVHVDKFDAEMLDEAEAQNIIELRWWKVAEMRSTDERFTPVSLADIVGDYFENGSPSQLPPEEVLVDWVAI